MKGRKSLIGILLTNTGTPASPSPADVRRYLAQFLSDPRVIDYPRWLWLPLLHGIILRTRPRRSAKLYRRIWTEAGSPLWVRTRRLAIKLRRHLSRNSEFDIFVAPAMCYGQPSIGRGLQALINQGADRIIILPLFPQFSGTTTGASLDAVFDALQPWHWIPDLAVISNYHDHPAYIRALSQSIQSSWDQDSPLLFSFHGIPKSYVDKGDPYEEQCKRTAALLASSLHLRQDQWGLSFQSRFGPREWLQPYTDQELAHLGASGLKKLSVACPGFAVDCLETLDEIAHEGRLQFQKAGGSELAYLPALNDSGAHIEALGEILNEKINQIRDSHVTAGARKTSHLSKNLTQ